MASLGCSNLIKTSLELVLYFKKKVLQEIVKRNFLSFKANFRGLEIIEDGIIAIGEIYLKIIWVFEKNATFLNNMVQYTRPTKRYVS